MSVVSVAACNTYDSDALCQAISALLAPLGGMGRFVSPGLRVLLKPNLLAAVDPGRAVTTHPALVQAVAQMVQATGGVVLIGDSPAGPLEIAPRAWRESGMVDVAARTGARLVPFDGVVWKRLRGQDYFVARPVLEAELVIDLPKLKTHTLTLYTGAVKNLLGVIPGTRKRALHLRAPGVQDFGQVLVDVLELAPPGLTILDGVWGQEGNGPGAGGTPRPYGCLAASADPVALDAVVADAMGFRPGEVLHLAQAGARGLGVADLGNIRVQGDARALDFGSVRLPRPRWYFRAPAWMGAPLHRVTRVQPRLVGSVCTGCGACAGACPRGAITPGVLPHFDLERCVGCFCCAEICPQGAIQPRRSLLARLIGIEG
jgi:uncharacterized protein (DUF362 family)/NAD-dependent dihydropyrimidine dehydrogenase PreA subunit